VWNTYRNFGSCRRSLPVQISEHGVDQEITGNLAGSQRNTPERRTEPRRNRTCWSSYLTVIAGVRPVALFLDVADSEVKKLVPLFRRIHLIAFVGRAPEPVSTWESPHRPEITSIFRGGLESSAFWVCRNRDDAKTIKKGLDDITAGQLLGYPGCCIDAHQQDNADLEDALVRAWTREFGDNPERIAQAWREKRKVPVEFEPKGAHRVPRTFELFPFVQHIACDLCLRKGDTPTAALNSAYRDLVAEPDPALCDYLVAVARRYRRRTAKNID
jgi:hypothetical protein